MEKLELHLDLICLWILYSLWAKTCWKYEKIKRFEFGPGDIIMSCRGTLGELFLLPEDAPIRIIHPSLMIIMIKNIFYFF